ncbi:MAG: DinB family protein [Vicinamibacteraceae bacterium]
MHTRELLVDTTPYLSPRLALDGITPELADRRIPGAPHTIAEIVAHMAFWQTWFSGRCDGTAGPMPASASLGWVAPEPGQWGAVRSRFLDGLDRLVALGAASDHARRVDPPIEFPPLAHYTVGDVFVHVATHNAHHLGQVVLLRQLLGAWPPPSGSWTW